MELWMLDGVTLDQFRTFIAAVDEVVVMEPAWLRTSLILLVK
jgi:hypothetical protein